ncbi:MAG: alpha-hydroxy acid oxidase, partial [Planctomycetia bacterium]
ARKAVACGVKAIFVSNHGGRQLDTVPTGLEALPGIVEAVADKAEIFVDGGVRRGTDAIKAICLGARGVLVGKPLLWALATAGTQGVLRLFQILHEELHQSMCLLGCGSVHQLSKDYLFP